MQSMQVGPRIPVGTQLEKAGFGPTSGPAWRLAHLVGLRGGPLVELMDERQAEVEHHVEEPLVRHLRRVRTMHLEFSGPLSHKRLTFSIQAPETRSEKTPNAPYSSALSHLLGRQGDH
jgi:hypothetical protein